MKQPRVLALILAGGKGSRMEALTEVRAKPTLPFAGVYCLIDFPLSNCVHSAISDVWVIEQFLPYSLNKYLANGRPWDLDRTYGGLQVVQPHEGTEESGFHQGNADAIYRNRRIIRDFDPELIVVLSADHIYKLDYSDVIAQHLDHDDADVTMVVTEVPLEQAARFGNVHFDRDKKVTDFAYKPDQPQSTWVTTEVFVYSAKVLLQTLDELVAAKKDQNGEEASLEDFGHELLPQFVKEGRAYAFPLDGYWRDVGTIESYWEGHMDLLASKAPIDLDQSDWPILTQSMQRIPAHIHPPSRIENSLISPGCVVHGEVVNSVLAPGVIVEEGAAVRNCVVLPDALIAAGATVEHAIIDRRARIGEKATVGAAPKKHSKKDGQAPQIALVGQEAHIAAGVTVGADARIEPQQKVKADVETGQSSREA